MPELGTWGIHALFTDSSSVHLVVKGQGVIKVPRSNLNGSPFTFCHEQLKVLCRSQQDMASPKKELVRNQQRLLKNLKGSLDWFLRFLSLGGGVPFQESFQIKMDC